MGRLSLVDPGDADTSPLAREALAAVRAARGGSVDPNVYWALANYPRELVRFGTVVYFGDSMTSAQRELTYLTFRAEVDLQTGEALALACPFACPDVLGG